VRDGETKPSSYRFGSFGIEETQVAPIDEGRSGDDGPPDKKLLLSGSGRLGSNVMIVDNLR
jgi:hypothetical protein